MKPLTKDKIINILKRTPSSDVIGFILFPKNEYIVKIGFISPNKDKYPVKRSVFARGDSFKQNVVDFLAKESLTKTIVDIRHRFVYSRCEVEVWLEDSVLETNIDWDVIDVFLKNIGYRGIDEL